MSNTAKILILFFVILTVGFMSYFKYLQDKHLHNLSVVYEEDNHRVGPFKFCNQDGDTITDKSVAGKIKVVEYFFTTCKSICPVMNENMSKVYQAFKGDDKIAILSHTVDPETDTVAQLKRYSIKFEAESRQWHFLTGSKKDLYTMAIESYLITAADSSVKKILPTFIHSNKFILVDGQNRIRAKKFYDGTDNGEVQQLIGDIKLLKAEMEDEEYKK
jgi:protein SCO1/2